MSSSLSWPMEFQAFQSLCTTGVSLSCGSASGWFASALISFFILQAARTCSLVCSAFQSGCKTLLRQNEQESIHLQQTRPHLEPANVRSPRICHFWSAIARINNRASMSKGQPVAIGQEAARTHMHIILHSLYEWWTLQHSYKPSVCEVSKRQYNGSTSA